MKIGHDYLERLRTLPLTAVKQSSPWVVLYMCGDGRLASTKFNFQVYRNKRGELSLVTNDKPTLQRLLEGREAESRKRIVQMDDAGWGYPLGGVLCGAYDFQTGRFYRGEVRVEYFQGELFRRKSYLESYRDVALQIIDKINPDTKNTMVKICTGYVNTEAKKALRERQFLVVEVDEIGEPLQSWLEAETQDYIRALTGEDVYYDPKALPKREVARRFGEAVRFARERNLMHLAKTGWKNFPRS